MGLGPVQLTNKHGERANLQVSYLIEIIMTGQSSRKDVATQTVTLTTRPLLALNTQVFIRVTYTRINESCFC